MIENWACINIPKTNFENTNVGIAKHRPYIQKVNKLDKGTKLDLIYERAFPNWKLSPEKIFAKMHLFGLEAEKWGITRWINVIWIIVLRCSGEKSGLQLICESSALPWSSLHPIQGAVNNFQYFCQVLISYCKVASTKGQ